MIVFTVPTTHDMVSQLLSPAQPKNFSDALVIAALVAHVYLLYALPSTIRIPVFAVVYLFWRAAYNAGIGYLLHIQSNGRQLVVWAKRSGIFEAPSSGKNSYPQFYKILKRELETKIPEDYKFEEAPIEFNTWLLFRRFVDLILLCDFVSYCCFAIACGGTPPNEHTAMTIARWLAGIGLFLFNLWVKLDAHRVVKDFAWYWGDFFFLIDQELTFDGVFEMAPHPMYTIGYTGYYGISLMAASYKVLFISIIAHAAQLAFLTIVESPHIEKTYNSPPPPRERAAVNDDDGSGQATPMESSQVDISQLSSPPQSPPIHNLLGIHNVDLHRITDTSVLLLQFYMVMITLFTPSTTLFQTLFVINAICWRLWYSIGIGFILDRQSKKKRWTRHFIKYGESTEEAWRQWKGLYHISMAMSYASFLAAACKMYHLPPDWTYGMALLRHVVGAALVALQIWTAISIHESLGEFGWFFGDFFFDQAPKLTYGGIYRFLNNPERIIGLAGVWGIALITWSKTMFFIALLSHVLSLIFLHFVERPHMQKLYGERLRDVSGLSKTLRKSLPPQLQKWQGSVDRVLDETVDFVEELVESARPKFAAGVGTVMKDSTALLKSYPSRITITRLAPDLAGFDAKDYSMEIEGEPSSYAAELERRSGKEGENARSSPRRTGEFRTLMFEYGAPIKVKWTAPLNHSKKDWIGLYMVADNAKRDVTRVASSGRWVPTNPGVYDARAENGILVSDVRVSGTDRQDGESQDYLQGEMLFAGDKLWWTTGVFEFRYHHDGKHNVMAISLPFEIHIGRFDEEDVEVDANNAAMREAVEKALLPVVRNCFDRDEDLAPETVDERWGAAVERDGKYAKRVVYAVREMFGIELAPEVVRADGNVRNLAWRVCGAKQVLVSFV